MKKNYTLSFLFLMSGLLQLGAQNLTATQTSGGPITSTSPYNGAGNNVGLIDTTTRQLFSASAPITGGRTSTQIAAKAAITTIQ